MLCVHDGDQLRLGCARVSVIVPGDVIICGIPDGYLAAGVPGCLVGGCDQFTEVLPCLMVVVGGETQGPVGNRGVESLHRVPVHCPVVPADQFRAVTPVVGAVRIVVPVVEGFVGDLHSTWRGGWCGGGFP